MTWTAATAGQATVWTVLALVVLWIFWPPKKAPTQATWEHTPDWKELVRMAHAANKKLPAAGQSDEEPVQQHQI